MSASKGNNVATDNNGGKPGGDDDEAVEVAPLEMNIKQMDDHDLVELTITIRLEPSTSASMVQGIVQSLEAIKGRTRIVRPS